MGIADLIPGVSGGTIAFITGIYERLLESIKTLQLHSIKKIAWSFILPLGGGILIAVFLVSRLFYYLLMHFPAPLFAFFLGVILASALFCSKKAGLNKIRHWGILIPAAFAAFIIAGMQEMHLFGLNFIGLGLAGMVASFAMLLPGISGSYLLQLFGIYPFLLAALNAPAAPGSAKMLMAVALGVSFGLMLFSRLVSALLRYLSTWTYAALVGFMLGGIRSIWPFERGAGWLIPLFFTLVGFFLVILLEMRMKKKESVPAL